MDYEAKFSAAHSYNDFLEKYGEPQHQQRWKDHHSAVMVSAEQKELLGSFVREMNVLCLAGTWCGDCVNQCPIFDRFAEITDKINVRFVDRDADAELAASLKICAGGRVPVVIFLSEDFHHVATYGDRTLSKYRQIAASLSGAACPAGIGVDLPMLEAVTADWLEEFERVQLILRTSARLRELHGD